MLKIPSEVVPIKREKFKPLLPEKPPLAIMLNGIGSRDKAEGRQGWRLK
jgi:hypothetical protein